MATKCGSCGVENENMQRCSKCHIVYYCSRQCQIKDWKKSHKKLCKGLHNTSERKGDVASMSGAPKVLNDQGCHNPTVIYPNDSCAACGEKDHLKLCARCLVVMYCSKFCQNKHWYQHKHSCQQNQDVVEVIQTDGYKKQVREANVKRLQSRRLQSLLINGFDSARGESRGSFGFVPMRCSDYVDLSIRKLTNKMERKQAKLYAERKFPMQKIVDTFDKLEDHSAFFYPHPMMYNTRTSFVGFITRYHHHKQRHCVYVEDDNRSEICVGFYLDYDSPFPYFTWADVRPGKFICLHDPTISTELCGQNQIRVDEAEDVHLFDI